MAKKQQKENYTTKELEFLIDNQDETKTNLLKYYSLLGDLCKNTPHFYSFFKENLIEENDLDLKFTIAKILLTKFQSRKKELKDLFNHLFTHNINILLFKQLLLDLKDITYLSSITIHPILKLYLTYQSFFKENHFTLSNEFFYIRSSRRDIHIGEYIYFQGHFEEKNKIRSISKTKLFKKSKTSKRNISFENLILPKKNLNLFILLLSSILDFNKNSIKYFIIDAKIEPEKDQGYFIFNTEKNDFDYQDPKWFAIIEKKQNFCAIIKLNYRDPIYNQCELCHRTFTHLSSKKYNHICFHCFYEKNKHLSYFEASDLQYYGSYRRFLKVALKPDYPQKLEKFEQLLKKNPTKKQIRKFYLDFKQFYKNKRKEKPNNQNNY